MFVDWCKDLKKSTKVDRGSIYVHPTLIERIKNNIKNRGICTKQN